MNDWRKNIQYNINNENIPQMIDAEHIKDNHNFLVDYGSIVKMAKKYFTYEPRIWQLPAKNYFVRICLAYYVASTFKENFYEMLDTNDILPYNDMFSPIYSKDKETYDKILVVKDFWKLPGYKKSIDIFKGVYEVDQY